MNNPLDARFLTFALELLLKSSVVLLLAFGIVRLLRRTSAQSRQGVWKAAFVGLVLLPLLCALMPTWNLPLSLSSSIEIAPALAPPMESAVQYTEQLEPVVAGTPTTAPEAGVVAPAIAGSPVPEIAPPLPEAAFEPVLPPAKANVPNPTYPIVLGIYLCGLGFVVLRSLAAFVRLYFLAKRAEVCTELHILDSGWEAARKLNLMRPVRLLIASPNSRERIPMTWGYWRPCVFLPSEAPHWELSRLHTVLLHEYAHIARADWLMQQITSLVCALYWFHPLVWRAARALKLESERACDECVIMAGISPTDYASVLLATARAHKQPNFSPEGAISMANPAHLSVRIQSILDSRGSFRTPSRPLVFCGAVLGLTGIMALSALRPADAALPPEAAAFAAPVTVPEAPLAELPPPAESADVAPAMARDVRPSDAFAKEIDPKAATLIKEVEAKAKSIFSLSADVQMTISNFRPKQKMAFGNGKMQQSGTFRMMKPNLYRLRYTEKQDNFVASDGTTEWIAQTDTVYQQFPIIANSSGNLPFPLSNFIVPCVDYAPYIGGLSKTLVKYRGKSKEPGEVFDIVEVVRHEPTTYMHRLYIGKDKLIHRLVLMSKLPNHHRTEVRLTNIVVNPKMSPDEFQFTPEQIQRWSAPRKSASKPKLTMFEPPAKPENENTGRIAWGQVNDGLQTGLRFLSDKETYTRADSISVQYMVRNVGKTPRRLQLSVPASIYLYNRGMKGAEQNSRSVDGEFRWMGREGNTSRRNIVLLPTQSMIIPLTIEPRSLENWGKNRPLPGVYTTHWETHIEYRDANKPNAQQRKMPEPGSLSAIIAAPPPIPRIGANGQPAVLYGKAVNGIVLGIGLPEIIDDPAYSKTPGVVRDIFSINGRLMLNPKQIFQMKVYLKNNTNQPITLSTYLSHSGDLSESGELVKGGVREIILSPFEEKYIYSPKFKYIGGERDFDILSHQSAFGMIVIREENERTLALLQEVRFAVNTEKISLQTGRLSLAVPDSKENAAPPFRSVPPRYTIREIAGEKLAKLLDDCLVKTDKGEIRRLLAEGADIRTRSKNGVTVLMFAACAAGDIALMKQALAGGVPIDARTWDNRTALMIAMNSRNVEKLRLLLNAGADINAQDDAGRTPLMWAGEFKFRAGIEYLLSRGANINHRNLKGKTALAYVAGHPGLTALLHQKGITP